MRLPCNSTRCVRLWLTASSCAGSVALISCRGVSGASHIPQALERVLQEVLIVMPYEQQISRDTPGCVIFLLDQSGSMAGDFAGTKSTKAEGAADAIQRLLLKLILDSTKDPSGVPRKYFEIAVRGFTGNAFQGELATKGDVVSIVDLYHHPLRLAERPLNPKVPSETIKVPMWFDPRADTGTPMCSALQTARRIADDWAARNTRSFPPIVILITDGQSTDGDPTEDGLAVQEVGTSDGNALLFCAHITSTVAQPVIFPATAAELGDSYAELMFNMCSVLPPRMAGYGRELGLSVQEGSRGMVFNATSDELAQLVDVGTRMRLR